MRFWFRQQMLFREQDPVPDVRPLKTYVKRLRNSEEIADSLPEVEKSYAIQAGREVRIMVKPEMVNRHTMIMVARDIVKRIESEMEYP